MSSDLSTLPKRMKYAAEVLQEAEKRYSMVNDTIIKPQKWDRFTLIELAKRWGAEERQVEDLANIIADYYNPYVAGVKSIARKAAKEAIEAGWRKDG